MQASLLSYADADGVSSLSVPLLVDGCLAVGACFDAWHPFNAIKTKLAEKGMSRKSYQ